MIFSRKTTIRCAKGRKTTVVRDMTDEEEAAFDRAFDKMDEAFAKLDEAFDELRKGLQ